MASKRGNFYGIPAMIQNLTPSEYARGAKLALENAECHLSVARQIADMKNYGMAISHLVLSSEELAKAAILKIRSHNEGIRIKNLTDYFRFHNVKHLMSVRITAVAITKGYMDESKDSKTTSKEKFLIFLLIVAVIVIIIMVGREGIAGEIQKLNEIRNRGFYVDYDCLKKMWLTPKIVHNEEEWKNAEQVILMLVGFLKRSLFADRIKQRDIRVFVKCLADENIVTSDLKDGLKELGESLS